MSGINNCVYLSFNECACVCENVCVCENAYVCVGMWVCGFVEYTWNVFLCTYVRMTELYSCVYVCNYRVSSSVLVRPCQEFTRVCVCVFELYFFVCMCKLYSKCMCVSQDFSCVCVCELYSLICVQWTSLLNVCVSTFYCCVCLLTLLLYVCLWTLHLCVCKNYSCERVCVSTLPLYVCVCGVWTESRYSPTWI